MPKITIKDRDGNVLYAAPARNAKSLVEKLVARKKTLARADLRGLDLTGINISRGDFTDALLDGADMRGSTCRQAKFIGASLRGVKAHGILADRAQFQGADCRSEPLGNRSHFDGGRLGFTNWSGARLDGASFDHATMDKASLVRAAARRATCRHARMADVDFSFGTFVLCDFTDADLRSTAKLLIDQQPDRAVWTTAIRCRLQGAKIDATVPVFRHDRAWSKLMHALTYTVSSAALFIGVHELHIDPHALLEGILDNGSTLIIAGAGLLVAKDILIEHVRDVVKERFEKVELAFREASNVLRRTGKDIRHFVMASIAGPGAKAVTAALAATALESERAGFLGQYWRIMFDPTTSVVFADRRHLALALETISAARTRHKMKGDVILLGHGGADSPTLVRYRADGGTSFAWTAGGKVTAAADYDRAGCLLCSSGLNEPAPAAEAYLKAFGAACLDRHGTTLKWNGDSHEIRAGKDGSIIVLNRMNQKIGNGAEPAVIRPDGSSAVYREGLPRLRPLQEDHPPREAPETQTAAHEDEAPLPAMGC